MKKRYAGLEAGGTKMVCCIGDEYGNIEEQLIVPTKQPADTMPRILDYFRKFSLEGLGIGCFGPLDMNKLSDSYGSILSTPKEGWQGINILQEMKKELHIPVSITTDVNVALLGEWKLGAAKGLKDVMYITVGTGIGAGILVDGKLLQGQSHPEAGHMIVKPFPKDDFRNGCVAHECCLEGMAAGPSIMRRWGKNASELPINHEGLLFEAYYLSQAIYNYMLIFCPQRIILGGGVMKQKLLFDMIRENVLTMNHDYLDLSMFGKMEEYIVPASLSGEQGMKGCLILGASHYE